MLKFKVGDVTISNIGHMATIISCDYGYYTVRWGGNTWVNRYPYDQFEQVNKLLNPYKKLKVI